ncbi:MAG: hypothetical protein ABIS92_00660 [Polyangia bacterium]
MRWRLGSWSTGTPRVLDASDVFVGFLCLYLLTASRTAPVGDAVPMWEAARSLIAHGNFAIEMRWPVNAPTGVGGHYYPVAALLAVLVHVPGALLQAALHAWTSGGDIPFVPLTSQVAPIVLGAAVPALLFRLLRYLRYDTWPAAWTTLLAGAGTSLWVYAHRPYAEAVQAICFLGAFGALLRGGDNPTRGACARLGLAFALLVNAKNVYLVCVPGAMTYLYWRFRRIDGRRRRASWGWAALGFLPGLLAMAWYNAARWGAVTSSGYGGTVTAGFWGEHILVGLWGQLLSPGKSLFLYAPPLLLSVWAWPRFWRQSRPAAAAMVLLIAPVVLLYARYLFWSGDWAWGPRYLVFAMPVLVIPIAALLAAAAPVTAPAESAGRERVGRSWPRPGLTFLLWTVLGTGAAVQLLGNAFQWRDFINISRDAQRAWLGRPDTSGTVLAPFPCYSCFEEVYPVDWLPPMQPIAGHWWLLRHKLGRDDWKLAAADAPWTRYTAVPVNLQASYNAARIDWWPLMAQPDKRWPLISAAVLLLLAIPLRPWVRALRRRNGANDAS